MRSSKEDSEELTIYQCFLKKSPMKRAELQDETIEFVRKSGLFRVEDLIVLVRAGYGQLSSSEKREFEKRLRLEKWDSVRLNKKESI